MSNIQEAQYWLLRKQLEQWVAKLGNEEPIEQEAVKELAVRLLTMAVMLLQQHVVNKRGRCRFCRWMRRPRCSVCGTLNLVMRQGLDVVWWQLFEKVGRQTSLEQVREWVTERKRPNGAV